MQLVMDRQADLAQILKDAQNQMVQTAQAVSAIQTISRQTNLLSLNASVEAARAGAAGKGFAVVAEEVRSLAQNSDTVSNAISTNLDQMQQYIKNVAQQFELLNTEISNQDKKMSSIRQIVTEIDETVTSVKGVMDMLLNQQ